MARTDRRRAAGPQPPPRNPIAAALRHKRPAVVPNKKVYTRKGRSRCTPQDRPFFVADTARPRLTA